MESDNNKADTPSRRLSRTESKLSAEAFAAVENAFGGVTGHSFDLMALDSNALLGKGGKPLPHFTPHPSPCSAGVNLFCQDLTRITEMSNPYIFCPFRFDWSSIEVFVAVQDSIHDSGPRVYSTTVLVARVDRT